MRRRSTMVVAVAVGVLVCATAAVGAGPSSDLFANVGPGGSVSALSDRFPLGHYALDQHFSAVSASLTGGIDASGVPSMIAFFLANLIWQITAFAANAVIALFAFAFSLDLLNGSIETGGAGALAPVSEAIAGLYSRTFGEPWMVIAVVLAGCWAMWRALVQRRYTETATGLASSLACCALALGIVTKPDATIGYASRLTNQLSTAFLSVSANGELADPTMAKRAAADRLFSLLVLRPWVALNFAGTEHCIRPNTGGQDDDPISVPVRPLAADPRRDAILRGQLNDRETVSGDGKQCVNNELRYAAHFLAYAPGSDHRDRQYEAINAADPARLPDSDAGARDGSYRPAVIDKPATDAMEKGGQYQRLLLALVIAAGELGALLLIGGLSATVVIAQVIVLLLACFAPVALLAAIVPGRGHDYIKAWLTRLATQLVRKAAYSLVLAILLAVSQALQDASANLGWLMAFGLQALLMWAVYLQRHTLAGQLTTVATGATGGGRGEDNALRRALALTYTTRTLGHPVRRRTAASHDTTDTGGARAAEAIGVSLAAASTAAPQPRAASNATQQRQTARHADTRLAPPNVQPLPGEASPGRGAQRSASTPTTTRTGDQDEAGLKRAEHPSPDIESTQGAAAREERRGPAPVMHDAAAPDTPLSPQTDQAAPAALLDELREDQRAGDASRPPRSHEPGHGESQDA